MRIAFLILALFVVGCLHGTPPPGSEQQGGAIVMPPSRPPISQQPPQTPSLTPLPETTIPPTREPYTPPPIVQGATPPPVTPAFPFLTSPPPASITREGIQRDILLKSLPIDSQHSYTVRAEDVRSIEEVTVDGKRGWLVTIVGAEHRSWWVYYSYNGTIFKIEKKF